MGNTTRRWPIVIGIISLLFLASACFQQVGDETQGPVNSIVKSDTPLPPPTLEPTDVPTATDVEAVDIGIAENASSTDTPFPSNTPIVVAQGDDQFGQPTQDPFELTSAALIEQATQRAVLPITETAAALGIGIVTATPTPTDTPFGLAPSSIGVDCVHEVRAGDTMWNLSQRYGLSVNEIATRNGISNFNLIIVGQRLTIPGCGTTGYFPPATSTPTPTITPFGFGQGGVNLGGDADVSAQSNGIQTQVAVCQSQYTIQQYDTLFTLSVRFGVPVQSIVNANPGVIVDENRINMGDTICIPSS